jgi:hypothetical protein
MLPADCVHCTDFVACKKARRVRIVTCTAHICATVHVYCRCQCSLPFSEVVSQYDLNAACSVSPRVLHAPTGHALSTSAVWSPRSESLHGADSVLQACVAKNMLALRLINPSCWRRQLARIKHVHAEEGTGYMFLSKM